MVTAIRISAPGDRLLDPQGDDWEQVSGEVLELQPTAIGSQPSRYVINAWQERAYGESGPLNVAAAHNGEAIFFRLSWGDLTRDDAISDTDRFGDGAGVLLPVVEGAPLQSMGSSTKPVNAWYWRADLDAPISVTANGLGSTVRQPNGSVLTTAHYADKGWQVVIARPLTVAAEGVAQLQPGQSTLVGFAVWQGSNKERAGIKAASFDWEPLEIEV